MRFITTVFHTGTAAPPAPTAVQPTAQALSLSSAAFKPMVEADAAVKEAPEAPEAAAETTSGATTEAAAEATTTTDICP